MRSTNPVAEQTDPAVPEPPPRLVSLDAYRGLIMLAMASAGLGHPASPRSWAAAGRPWRRRLDHVAWVGCAVWDLIQPAFMFMVGVALPYSYAAARPSGQTRWQMLRHALSRSLILVALGVFCASAGSKQTNFMFTNVLAQIGLGYTLVYLLRGRGVGCRRPRLRRSSR